MAINGPIHPGNMGAYAPVNPFRPNGGNVGGVNGGQPMPQPQLPPGGPAANVLSKDQRNRIFQAKNQKLFAAANLTDAKANLEAAKDGIGMHNSPDVNHALQSMDQQVHDQRIMGEAQAKAQQQMSIINQKTQNAVTLAGIAEKMNNLINQKAKKAAEALERLI